MDNPGIGFTEELVQEIAGIPQQHWSKLLQIIRLFRESVVSTPESTAQDSSLIEAIEDLGLIRAMQEVKGETPLSLQEALSELESL